MNGDPVRLSVLIPEDRIREAVGSLAAAIDEYYQGQEVVAVSVLNGAFFFAADLLKILKTPCTIDFIQAKSYAGTASAGHVRIVKEPDGDITGKDILLIEDIVDTGITLDAIVKYLFDKGAVRVTICSLLNKRKKRKIDREPHFFGFEMDDRFVVGYGLDMDGRYRMLRDVCVVTT